MIENGQRTQVIQGLTFELKGEFYPEQYKVFDENNQEVAYVRLRHGELYVSDPDLNEHWWNTNNWDTSFPKDRRLQGDGFFDDDEERTFFLNFIAKIIHKKLQNPSWEAWQENGLLREFSSNLTTQGLTERQKTIPNLEQAIADSPSFVRDILAMPKIEGHEDLFERSNEVRQGNIDDLDFSKEKK